MQDNIIICNHKCNAGCIHCIYSIDKYNRLLEKNSFTKIYEIAQNLIILSGGEPFELDISELKRYLSMCIITNKYFKIATGGHILVEKYLSILNNKRFFAGLQIGTDVLSRLRNKDHTKHLTTWINNIEILHRKQMPYSITITLSQNLDLANILELIKFAKPNYIMVNALDKLQYKNTQHITMIKDYFPQQPIIHGYIY